MLELLEVAKALNRIADAMERRNELAVKDSAMMQNLGGVVVDYIKPAPTASKVCSKHGNVDCESCEM